MGEIQVLVAAAQRVDLVDREEPWWGCLLPNWRPISGSEAEVSCFTMYMATCRGKAMAFIGADLQILLAQSECLAHLFLDQVGL